MNVLITYAVDPEFAPWCKLIDFENISAGDFQVHRASLGPVKADFLVTGMGSEHAARAIEAMKSSTYDACICAGFAGALSAEYQVGDVVVPEQVKSIEGSTILVCGPALVEAAKAAKRARMLLSSSRIIATSAEKIALSRQADVVDMESFTIISAVHERGIPALAVRAVSDTRDQDMPVDFSKSLDEHGQVSTNVLLRQLAGQPGRIGALMRLGRQSKQAAEALAQFLLGYLQALPNAQQSNAATLASEMRGR